MADNKKDIQNISEKTGGEKNDILKGAVFAAIAGLIGTVLWMVLGYFYSILIFAAGILFSVFTCLGFSLFYKKSGWKKYVICGAISAVYIFLTAYIWFAVEEMLFYSLNETAIPLGEAFTYANDKLGTSEGVSTYLIECFAGIGFAALGMGVMILRDRFKAKAAAEEAANPKPEAEKEDEPVVISPVSFGNTLRPAPKANNKKKGSNAKKKKQR